MAERDGDPIGRLCVPDGRDRDYPMRPEATDHEGQDALNRGYRYWWADGWWGDQWYTPQCVAYAWLHWAEDGPTTHHPRVPNRQASVMAQGQAILNPDTVYREAQKIDEWPGEDYDGTSVRAGAKILQRHGYITEYRWTWDLDVMAEAILVEGPVVVGTWWYESMFYPDDDGLITVGGNTAGGHAYLVNGVNRNEGKFRIKNSWGREWGNNGFAWISFDDMGRLLDEYGEACLAIEQEQPQQSGSHVVQSEAELAEAPAEPDGFMPG